MRQLTSKCLLTYPFWNKNTEERSAASWRPPSFLNLAFRFLLDVRTVTRGRFQGSLNVSLRTTGLFMLMLRPSLEDAGKQPQQCFVVLGWDETYPQHGATNSVP
jgi:hypothetical protein